MLKQHDFVVRSFLIHTVFPAFPPAQIFKTGLLPSYPALGASLDTLYYLIIDEIKI